MAKWCGSVTAVWYFDAPDKDVAAIQMDQVIHDLAYRDWQLSEVSEAEFEREASDNEKREPAGINIVEMKVEHYKVRRVVKTERDGQ